MKILNIAQYTTRATSISPIGKTVSSDDLKARITAVEKMRAKIYPIVDI
jgi:hypothetical protein